jgi:hypothetical protein
VAPAAGAQASFCCVVAAAALGGFGFGLAGGLSFAGGFDPVGVAFG